MERIAALAAALSAASGLPEIERAVAVHGAALAGASNTVLEEIAPGTEHLAPPLVTAGQTVASVPVSGVAASPRTALTFTWPGGREVDPLGMRELETIADMVAPALARTRLLSAERDARRRTELLHALAAELSAAALPEDVAEAAAPHVLDALAADRCSIVLAGDEYHDAYSADADGREPGWSRWPRGTARLLTPDLSAAGTYVEAHGRAEMADRYSPEIVAYLADELGIVSLVVAPLAKGRGRVTAMFRRRCELQAADRSLLMTVARLVGQAVERADLHRAEHAARELEARARARSELIASLVGQLEEEHGVAARARRLVEVLVPRLADFALVETCEPDPVLLAVRHGQTDEEERLRELLDARPPHAADEAGLVEPGQGHWLDRLGACGGIVVLLDVPGSASDPLRLVLALTDADRRPYDADDLAFAVELADRASLSIESARLLEHEHATAVAFQRALLPDTLIRHSRLAIAARYLPADSRLQVGGDWYDAMSLPDGRVAFSVGDVVGKGLASAVTMGALRTAMSALAGGTQSPAALLEQLDDFANRTDGARFATAAYAVLDPATRVLQYASAGHPPILIADANGRGTFLEDGRSWPLGSPASRPRGEGVIRLPEDCTLVLYSDGLVERRRERVSQGLEALLAAVIQHVDLPPDALSDAVIADLCRDGRGVQDDVVLLVVRLMPASAPAFRRTLPIEERELAALRRDLREWMDAEQLPPPVRSRLLLGVGEACANALEHAYREPTGGEIEISILQDGEESLLVTVRDNGRWRPRARRADRGRGTALMRSVADGFERRSGVSGTTVTLRYRVPAAG
jgi:serine/threonine-protein kinase RsbW